MIYLDSSVVLSRLFTEARRPSAAFWDQATTSSRLLAYEVWNRVHVHNVASVVMDDARRILRRVELFDMTADILARALEPFPLPVRTLDGLHLATMDALQRRGLDVELASYDIRLLEAAAQMGFGALEP